MGKQMTHAERIRQMDDHELADFLANIQTYVPDGKPLFSCSIGGRIS